MSTEWIYLECCLYFMNLLLVFAYRWIEWHIPPLIPFSIINDISITIKISNFTLDFFKAACHHANPGAEINFAGSSLYILTDIFLKFSNTSANNNVSLWRCKSWHSPKLFCFKIFTNPFCMCVICITNIFHI